MPLQDSEPIPDNYTREWVSNETQRVDENGNLMWEKQLKRDIKAGKPAVPILNFPAGGYWRYTAIDKEGNLNPYPDVEDAPRGAIVYYKVPDVFTHFTKQKDYTGKADKDMKGVKKDIQFSKEHLKKLQKAEIEAKFKAFQLEQFDGDQKAMDDFQEEVRRDWSREARFEGDKGFIATKTADGGYLPGNLLDSAPAGYYWKRDAEGNDIWKDGRRVPAPLYEGKGLTRAGKVAGHLETHGRGGMYGGSEKIQQQLQEAYPQNDSYIAYLSQKYAPDTAGGNYSAVPPQTPAGEEDVVREDKTKATRDWTWHNIISVNPEEYTMGDPYKYWLASSEGRAELEERKKWENEMRRDFSKWMYKQFSEEQEQHKGTFMEGKTIPWGALGISYDKQSPEDWRRAKGAKKELYELYEAQYRASTKPALDEPGVEEVEGLAVQMNGVVLDDRARPTGEVVDAPQDDMDSDDDIDDWFDDEDSDAEVVVERIDEADDTEFQDDADTYGRRITSGQGKQLRWDAGK